MMLTLIFMFGTSVASAAPPSKYFVDEAKLPFEVRLNATAYWGGTHRRSGN